MVAAVDQAMDAAGLTNPHVREYVNYWAELTGAERVEVPVPERVPVIEAIGAGDAFAAGLLAGILQQLPLFASVEQGHRTAARALSSITDHIAPGSRR